jgi:hypothetical protein
MASVASLSDPKERLPTEIVGRAKEIDRSELQGTIAPTVELYFLNGHPLVLMDTRSRVRNQLRKPVSDKELLSRREPTGAKDKSVGSTNRGGCFETR